MAITQISYPDEREFRSFMIGWKEVLVREDGLVWTRNIKRNGDDWKLCPVYHGSHGYLRVCICKSYYFVHRLVAFAFGVCPTLKRGNGLDVDHIDNDRFNNHYLNLQCVTKAENRAKETEAHRNSNSCNYMAIQGKSIILARSIVEMSEFLGVDKSFVSQVVNGKRNRVKGFTIKRIPSKEEK